MSSEGRAPGFVRAVMAALRFDNPDENALATLTNEEWERALEFTDSSQLSLALYRVAADALPANVAERIRGDMERNKMRLAQVFAAYDDIARVLESTHLNAAILKGFTSSNLDYRVQYDIDLMLSPDDARLAASALTSIGYEAVDAMEEFPTDHLPVMTRKTGWEWRGDYFDPDIPVMVDLHFRFWDEETERIALPEVEEFRGRICTREIRGRAVRCLHPVDALGYCCLHILRHLLRGSLKVAHLYELAYILQNGALSWADWERLHSEKLRMLQAVCFALAHSWFGPRLSSQAADAVERLPGDVREWIARYGMRPLESRFHPNKSEVLLHLLLLERWRDRITVLRRRLLPARMPGPVDAVCLPAEALTWRIRARAAMKYTAYLTQRIAYHLRAAPSFVGDAARWTLRSDGIGKQFWVLLAASALFDVGMYVFVVLYNLYLLDRGFTAEHLGWIASSMTVGSIAGTLPAAAIARRLGLRSTVMLAFGGTACLSALRAVLPGMIPLMLASFFAGALFALWAVSIAPAVAGLVTEGRRARAFSIFFSTGILLGIPAGWIAGRLPEWIVQGKQGALLATCVLAASALIPVSRLRLPAQHSPATATYPKGRFVARFLFAFSLWHLATGAFNPFFNAYFAVRHNAATQAIGTAFSTAQAVQIFTLLASPVVLRKLGLARGVGWMMAATALGLVFLAAAPNRTIAMIAYAAYMGFEWMSEPGINTLLMNRVSPEQRAGASSLYYLTAFAAQAFAAASAGVWISRGGFAPVLLTASLVSIAAALMFRRLATEPQPHGLTLPSPRSIPESAS